MKTIYAKNLFIKLLKCNVFTFLLVTLSFNVKAQYSSPQVICFGEPIHLYCGGLFGCDVAGSTYTWANETGSWMSNDINPVILPGSPGYSTGHFYLSVQYLPDGLSSGVASAILLNPFFVSGITTPISCNGGNNGSIEIFPDGGQPEYGPYLWSNGATTMNISGLTAGIYTVTVTDANNCTTTAAFTVSQSPGMSIVKSAGSDVSCNGYSNGYIAISVAGGAGNYIYTWSNGGTSATIGNLSAGNYSVTVSDINSCTKSASYTITQPSDITISGTPVNITCQGGNTGLITTTISGGSGGINTYLWNNGQSGPTATNLTAGSYTVTVTNGAGCKKSKSFEVTAMTLGAVVVIPAKCYNSSNGSIQLFVSGGTSPYSYLWNNGQTASTAINLSAGVYSVTVTDGALCAKVGSWQVSAPPVISISSVITPVLCNGNSTGKIDITINGGTPGYSYKWNVLGYQGQGTAHVSQLFAGTYTVTVTDYNSCAKIQNFLITQPVALSSNGQVKNVTCFGGNNGTASISGLGGTAPYSYKWSTGSNNQYISGLSVGRYYVTIADANTCINLTFLNITQPSEITITGTPSSVACQGSGSGMITTTVSGGSGGTMAYLWSNGQTGSTATNLSAGVYTVTVTNTAGCSKTKSFLLTETVVKIITLVEKKNPLCYAGNNGSIQISVSGGLGAPYQYLWNNGQTTAGAVNLTAGIYTVTVTDAGSCPVTGSWSLVSPNALSVTAVQTNVLCNGSSTGKVDITVTGGSPSYTYNWNVLSYQGKVTPHISGLYAGTYTVTVTDQNSCVKMQSWLITQPSSLSGNGSATNVTCYGGNNGTATISGFGGTTPYVYKWSNGSTLQRITGLTVGRYSVTFSDANSCSNLTWFDITQPSSITITGTTSNVTCAGGDGKITTTVTGGTPGYYYKWNDSQNQITPIAVNLTAGFYIVTVTDINTCSKIQTFAVIQNPPLNIIRTGYKDPSCYLSSDGYVTVSASGGMGSYTYNWTGGGTSATLTGLSTGTYTVTVSDQGQCTKVGSYSITAPPALTITAGITAIKCSGESTGKIDLTVSGGTTAYNYLWSSNVPGGLSQRTTAHIFGLGASTYTVTVTDAHTCVATGVYTITQPSMISAMGVVTNLKCFGGTDGSATISGAGGTPPYYYTWNTGSHDQRITGLNAGRYIVTITDANSCFSFTWQDVTAPSEITIVGTPVKVTCFGGGDGKITTSVTGGTPGYIYKWNNNQTTSTAVNLTAGFYIVTVTDFNTCSKTQTFQVTQNPALTITRTDFSNPLCNQSIDGWIQVNASGGLTGYSYLWNNGQTTSRATGLPAGTYTVVVTDGGLCSATGSWFITAPPALTITAGITPLLCEGESNGKIDLTVSGGTTAYQYLWSGNVPGSLAQRTTAHITGLTASTYTVTVTDAHLCAAIGFYTVTQPTKLSGIGVVTNPKCFGGSDGTATITGTGGTTPYSYTWSTGSQQQLITGLAAGRYTVSITDAHNCFSLLWQDIVAPPEIIIVGTPFKVTCFGGGDGKITTSVTGGTTGYTYKWNNNQTTPAAVNLSAGFYTVTVTDAYSCTRTSTFQVNQNPALSITRTDFSDPLCNLSSDGWIQVSVAGGLTSYSYLWNNGQTTSRATGLSKGIYTVVVTDGGLCTATNSWSVTAPAALTITPVVTHVKCEGEISGKIDLTVNGGTTDYKYLWSNNVPGGLAQRTSAHITGLAASTYTVTITDAHTCTAIGIYTVTQPTRLYGNGVVTNPKCFGGTDGTASFTGVGGTSPYYYTWSTGSHQQLITGLSAGRYYVSITDANNCFNFTWQDITQPMAIIGNGVVSNVTCYGGNNGVATITAFGGTSPYNYRWATGSNSQMITGLTAGVYYVTISDANSCFNTTSQVVTQPSDITIVTTPVNVTCAGSNNGQITTTVSGGYGGAWTYLWNNGQTGSTATNLSAGTYTVTVTNGAGCRAQSQPTTVGTTNQLPGSAGAITGPTVVNQGQSGVAYSVIPIANATGYIWTLPSGATISSGPNSPNITVDFSSSATSGVISVKGTNICGNGTPSPDLNITVIPLNVSLQNITLGPGIYCYNAIHTIYVAGGTSTFIVNSGASVTMIAGYNIIYLPGTTVRSGGYMHGYITVNGQYCTTPLNPIVNNPVQVVEEQTSVPELTKNQRIRIYPNPANGSFTLELTGASETGMRKVDIYSMNGVNVMSGDLAGERKHIFLVEGLHPGIYFIHVTTGNTLETLKLIKL